MKRSEEFRKTIDIIVSNSSNLYDLAVQAGCDPFDFYNGADLSGLDLSGCDLSGMNFDRTLLIGAKLEGITFDAGSLNLAYIDQKYEGKLDSFNLHLDEVAEGGYTGVGGYGRFRKGHIDLWKSEGGFTFYDIASYCRISESTLRKARYGGWVLMSTVSSIATGLLRLRDEAKSAFRFRLQPSVEFAGYSRASSVGGPREQFILLGRMAQLYEEYVYSVTDKKEPYIWYSNYFLLSLYESWMESEIPNIFDFFKEWMPYYDANYYIEVDSELELFEDVKVLRDSHK